MHRFSGHVSKCPDQIMMSSLWNVSYVITIHAHKLKQYIIICILTYVVVRVCRSKSSFNSECVMSFLSWYVVHDPRIPSSVLIDLLVTTTTTTTKWIWLGGVGGRLGGERGEGGERMCQLVSVHTHSGHMIYSITYIYTYKGMDVYI